MSALLASLFVRLLTATLRIRHVHAEHMRDTPQYIIVFWHCHLLPILGRAVWRRPITVMVSRSKDGELIAGTLAAFGVESSRGSSSRGGSAALRGILREAREGKNIVFTPDGPRGPARIAKDGVIYAAQVSGLPILPVSFAARKQKLLGSWDRMVIPYPFSRSVLAYGEPMHIPRDADTDAWREKLETTLNALAAEAEQLVTT